MRVFIAGPPKTGNVWVERLLADLYGLRVQQPPEVPASNVEALRRFVADGRFPDGVVLHQHFAASNELFQAIEPLSCPVVAVLRHPADAFVSLYHYVQAFAADFEAFDDPAACLIGLPIDHPTVLTYLADPFEDFLSISASWIDNQHRALVVRYEDLQTRPVATLRELADRIQPAASADLERALAAARPEVLRATDESLARHIRTASVGDWQKVLPERHRQLLYNRYATMFRRLGYALPVPADATSQRHVRAVGYAFAADGANAAAGASAGVTAQNATIRAWCVARGWELVGLRSDQPVGVSPRPAAAATLAALKAGEVDAVVTVRLAALADGPEQISHLIDDSIDRGLGLVGVDLGVDTTTEAGLVAARYVSRTLAQTGPAAATPVPPAELLYLATGTTDDDWFDRTGRQSVEELALGAEAAGRTLESFRSVLDFGCGAGRVLRHLAPRLPGSRFAGCDVVGGPVVWLQSAMPSAEVAHTAGLPPLPWPDRSFDLVYGWSVFTHLDERYQDAWLAELRRVLEPGGVALLTVNGPTSWRWHIDGPIAGEDALADLSRQLANRGFAFWAGDGWEAWFPDWYHTAWHLPAYVERRWSKWFDVVAIREAGAGGLQDLVVLRRPQSRRPLRRVLRVAGLSR